MLNWGVFGEESGVFVCRISQSCMLVAFPEEAVGLAEKVERGGKILVGVGSLRGVRLAGGAPDWGGRKRTQEGHKAVVDGGWSEPGGAGANCSVGRSQGNQSCIF